MLDMPLEELAFRVNNRLCEDNPEEMFVTAFIGMLDTEQGILTFVNAGHKPSICIFGAGTVSPGGLPFGLCTGPVGGYEVQGTKNWSWENREPFFFIQTGLRKLKIPKKKCLGEQRLKAVLDRCAPEEDPKRDYQRISMAVKDFSVEKGAVQTDDITMLCVRALCRKEGNER